jgi:hypothetical protein
MGMAIYSREKGTKIRIKIRETRKQVGKRRGRGEEAHSASVCLL